MYKNNMEKKIINAVRIYLIKDEKVVVIKYKDDNLGFYDIPGGKLEGNETPEEASIREFKEETGMTLVKQHHIGQCNIEYPDRIYKMNIFMVDDYSGEPMELTKNKAMWMDIVDLEKEINIFSTIKVIKYLKDEMNLKIECDNDHKIVKIEDLNN